MGQEYKERETYQEVVNSIVDGIILKAKNDDALESLDYRNVEIYFDDSLYYRHKRYGWYAFVSINKPGEPSYRIAIADDISVDKIPVSACLGVISEIRDLFKKKIAIAKGV